MSEDLAKLSRYSSNMSQFAEAVMSEIADGPAKGSRIIHVSNGSGLNFTIMPDRAMDLVECYYNGTPVAFRSPVGYASPYRYEPDGIKWLRNWPAGLMTTAGLRSTGNPGGDFGLHGRIGNQPAEDVAISRGVDADGNYRITVSGTVREAMMFGEYLEMRRSISVAHGVNEITVKDYVTNRAATDDVVQILYHCNFGYPLVSPSMRLVAEKHNIVPRTDKAKANIADWAVFPAPIDGFEEECFFHELPADANGIAAMAIENPDVNIRLRISYDTSTLPRLVEWKNPLAGYYVLGLEPTNTWLNGHDAEVANGTARKIASGETIEFGVRFSFSELA